MNSNVVSLSSKRPHLAGLARCMDCKHEWQAVAPIGTTFLECPACSLLRGRLVLPVLRDKHLHFECNCGNDLFHKTPEGNYCPNCGEWIIE